MTMYSSCVVWYICRNYLSNITKSLYPLAITSPTFPFPHALKIITPPCFYDLTILDPTFACDCIVFVFLCLDYFTQHNVLQIHLHCCKWQALLTTFFYPFIWSWPLWIWLDIQRRFTLFKSTAAHAGSYPLCSHSFPLPLKLSYACQVSLTVLCTHWVFIKIFLLLQKSASPTTYICIWSLGKINK